jgi:DNA polymerase
MTGSSQSPKHLRKLLDLIEDYLTVGFHTQRRNEKEGAQRKRESSAGAGAPVVALADNPSPRHREGLAGIAAEIAACRKCKLCRNRNLTVPGAGVEKPLVLLVGEGPGAEEDRSGLPFVGRAGRYLDRWLAAVTV